MARFIHTADWHLGALSAHPVFSTALEKLIDFSKEHGVDVIVCAGDIFDRPHPDQKTKDYLLEKILENKEIRFIFSVGNHDYATKARDYHSLSYLYLLSYYRRLPNVQVLEPGYYYPLDKVVFWAPEAWGFESNFPDTEDPVVALWHGIVPGIDITKLTAKATAVHNSVEKIISNGKISYIALGDIHKRLRLHERCYYPGALYQRNFSDEAGICIVTIEKGSISVTPAKLDLPEKVTLVYENERDTEESIIRDVKSKVAQGNIVKIQFNLPPALYSTIDRQSIHAVLTAEHCLDVVFENMPTVEVRKREKAEEVAAATSEIEELERVIETISTIAHVDKKLLLQKLKQMLQHSAAREL